MSVSNCNVGISLSVVVVAEQTGTVKGITVEDLALHADVMVSVNNIKVGSPLGHESSIIESMNCDKVSGSYGVVGGA